MSRTQRATDLSAAAVIAAGSVLLGAPAGLLWSQLSPRVTVKVSAQGADAGDIESTKAFIGADGSYFVIMLLMGVLCGVLAWWVFRRSGPFAVLALVVGGALAALVAGWVGLIPGADAAVHAVTPGSPFRGSIDLYLGRIHQPADGSPGAYTLALRSAWAFLAWPAGACIALLAALVIRPEELES